MLRARFFAPRRLAMAFIDQRSPFDDGGPASDFVFDQCRERLH